MKRYECLWYNGDSEPASYELLDFNPNKLLGRKLTEKNLEKVRSKAWRILKGKYLLTSKSKMIDTLYLVPVDSFVRLG